MKILVQKLLAVRIRIYLSAEYKQIINYWKKKRKHDDILLRYYDQGDLLKNLIGSRSIEIIK